jgi:hypothetical protein
VQHESHRVWTKKKSLCTGNIVKISFMKIQEELLLYGCKTMTRPALTCRASASVAIDDNMF